MSSDASDNKNLTAAQKKKAAEKILADIKRQKKEDKEQKQQKGTAHTRFLEKQLRFKKEKWEYQKKRAKEKAKERAEKEPLESAKRSLSSIKSEKISEKDKLGTAYGKAVGNLSSFASGVAGAAFHGARALAAKKRAEKEVEDKQQEKRERKSPGRPSSERKSVESEKKPVASEKKQDAPSKKETKQLVPATKRLMPATKSLQPSGGVPDSSRGPKAKTLGQRARQNPKIRAGLIAQRMEEFSNWREEILIESELLFEIETQQKKNKKDKKIIDVMKGKNKIIMNPEINEDHKEISRGQKKDDEGYMANVELDQMERAIKALRKKVKKADTQLPAWVQSKITRAVDYIDTASEYMQSSARISEEKDEKRYCKLCRKEEKKSECSYGPQMWEKYSMNKMAEAVDKNAMKCNKPKAQAHGSGETGKSHVVKACEGGEEKLIRFGQLGVKGSPKKEGESEAYASRRNRFKTRHAKNIARGKMSAAYWANKVKW